MLAAAGGHEAIKNKRRTYAGLFLMTLKTFDFQLFCAGLIS